MQKKQEMRPKSAPIVLAMYAGLIASIDTVAVCVRRPYMMAILCGAMAVVPVCAGVLRVAGLSRRNALLGTSLLFVAQIAAMVMLGTIWGPGA
jgi:hypothetical protein